MLFPITIPPAFLIEKKSKYKDPFDQLELVCELPLQTTVPLVRPEESDETDVPHVIEIQL